MLPGVDGVQVLRALRTAHQSPVLCLAARDSFEDSVKGLEAGANDYIVKPFSFAELLARVRAQLRQHVPAFTRLTIKGLDLDSTKHTVSRNEKTISMDRKELLLPLVPGSRAGGIV
ncbi:response regulator, partial [Salmonella enterica]|uniref:response regulator n=1 Tax=Salmonella enterica TaxID=28901 RepID=UPI00398C6F1C